MFIRNHILWLAWETHTRNISLSAHLGAQLIQLDYPELGRAHRYLRSTLMSIGVLRQWQRKTIIAQNPSMALCLLCILFKPLFRYSLIVDAHNSGIFPKEGNAVMLQWVADLIIRLSSYTIVTNENLAKIITQKKGRPIILPDPLPTLHTPAPAEPLANSVIFICSWAADEPFSEVFKAAEALPAINFYVTGKSKGREQQYGKPLPANIKLTGYLPESEYLSLLNACDLVLDLTTRDHCLVCGAYEAVSFNKPFVLSNNQATQDYFRIGGAYCDNTAASIARCIEQVLSNKTDYIQQVEQLHRLLLQEWQNSLHTAQKLIHQN